MLDQASIDESNRRYWQEMCGSTMARDIGVTGDDRESLAAYDRYFFGFYYYMDEFIPFNELAGKDVLEVGLGYGSVSQRLAASGARFTGLDIASGPVHWINHRLASSGFPGKAIEGSALDMPFPDDSFDYVVTIGCLHHTGDLQKGISEVHRVLRRGGRATIMVYNATSYLRWLKFPITTFKYAKSVSAGYDGPLQISEKGRGDFDTDTSGSSAPETSAVSKTSLSRMLRGFSSQSIHRTNVADHRVSGRIPRRWRNAAKGPLLGLDLYALVKK